MRPRDRFEDVRDALLLLDQSERRRSLSMEQLKHRRIRNVADPHGVRELLPAERVPAIHEAVRGPEPRLRRRSMVDPYGIHQKDAPSSTAGADHTSP